jgi:hypothetical protein
VLGNMFGHSPTDNESGFRYVMSELHFKKADERPEYILMSGNLHVESPESVEELLSKGGHYVEKPIKLEDFRLLIEKLAEETIGP